MRYILTIGIQLSLFNLCFAQNNTYAKSQVSLLQDQLHYYQHMQEKNWTYFPCDEELEPGDRDALVPLLRNNLLITGDLKSGIELSDPNLMDSAMEEALKQFQRRHYLTDDGILGANTIKAMNVPLSERRNQIEHAISRWEEFAQMKVQTYLLINLPDYSLTIIDSGINIQQMKVLIGKNTSPTTAFYSELSYLIIHPTWMIPHPMAVQELLPLIKADKNYLVKNKIEVFTYKQKKKVRVPADTIQWDKITTENLRYEFEQLPGPWNALGSIKFMFPNEYNVYIHDTPDKYLFNYNKRTFTHGCIRVENPQDLAAWLLHKSNEEVTELMEDSLDDTIFPLNQPICTCIDHFNAWVNPEGLLQFRENVYKLKN